MYTVFLTGGIGSGKSTVRALMAQKGARVIDLDEVAHEVLGLSETKRDLALRFGDDILVRDANSDICDTVLEGIAAQLHDDAGQGDCLDFDLLEGEDIEDAGPGLYGEGVKVDRALLAQRAFATREDTDALNVITHSRIFERLGELLTNECRCTGLASKLTVVEVPLIEKSREGLFLADEVLAVACPVELRRKRAAGRGMAPADFDERDGRQICDGERAAFADTVLINDGDEEQLAVQVDAWWRAREAMGWRRSGERVPGPEVAVRAEAVAMMDSTGMYTADGEPLKSPAVAVVGRHNSGKTTLVTAVIASLAGRGVDVGSVKHHGHRGFDVDVPGKDSWRHREAGANEVAVCSPDRFALMREIGGALEVPVIVNMMRPHDVVVVEGYRHSGLPTIEIMRSDNERDAIAAREFLRAVAAGEPFQFDPASLGDDAGCMPDGLTVGVATDMEEVREAARSIGLAAFDLDDPASVADFIVERYVAASDRV